MPSAFTRTRMSGCNLGKSKPRSILLARPTRLEISDELGAWRLPIAIIACEAASIRRHHNATAYINSVKVSSRAAVLSIEVSTVYVDKAVAIRPISPINAIINRQMK